MKIFIWENVLRDYTAGMAVAYAETLEQAFSMLTAIDDLVDDYLPKEMGSPTKIIDCETDKEAFGTYVWGGG